MQIFLDCYLLGDGSLLKQHINRDQKSNFKNIKFNESKMYFTISKRNGDDLSEIILKMGKVPNLTIDKTKGKLCKFKNGIIILIIILIEFTKIIRSVQQLEE